MEDGGGGGEVQREETREREREKGGGKRVSEFLTLLTHKNQDHNQTI